LHDIGKTFIPEEIINKPDKLTDEEFEYVKKHPLIGYELIKDVPTIGILPPHVAIQHHEKQDGTGYPRGLKGDNRLNIPKDPRRIHLYGHIVAVADIYDALSSDRPYRKAFPPEKVLKIMRDMKETHLNRDALRYFMLITPVYPVGSTIRVLNGNFRNHFGVVVCLNEEKLERPIIRLVYNGYKKKIDPVDVNLTEEEDVKIETVLF
ncbi:HD-GYP domain-containing protein, partial [Candidatus Latescibacterota bacterium]